MTEQELQKHLLKHYPKEDESCEWKEFKNLKNDFNGKAKDDVTKARLRLKEQCTNLPTEGLAVQEHITDDTHKTVWVISIPKPDKQKAYKIDNILKKLREQGLITNTTVGGNKST